MVARTPGIAPHGAARRSGTDLRHRKELLKANVF
jgi:hypothetical protein